MNFNDQKIKIILVGISFFLFSKYLDAQTISFRNYLVNDGLSNNDINCILEDKQGFIWIGTEDGLNRFDGYNFYVYRNIPEDHHSLSSNSIWSLFEDEDGFIWVGTKSGELNCYNPFNDSFTNWSIDSGKINENGITAILKNSKDDIWIGSYRNGLYKLNINTGKILNWNYNPLNKSSLSNNFVTAIVIDQTGNLWISTYNGLNKINFKQSAVEFTRFYLSQKIKNINSDLIWNLSFSIYDKNILYISTSNGLVKKDIQTDKYEILNFFDRPDLQFSNSISSVTEHKNNTENVLWISSYAGLIRKSLNTGTVQRYIVDESKSDGLKSNQINRVLIDRSGVLWIAQEQGLSCVTNKGFKFNYKLFAHKYGVVEQLKSRDIKSICQTSDGNIWLGDLNGIYTFNPKTGNNNIEKVKSSINLNIWTLFPGNKNEIWIGTYGQGLKKLNTTSGIIKHIKIESPTFKTSAFEYVKSLYLTKNEDLWIGFWGGGIARLNTVKGDYKIWLNEAGNNNSLSYNDIWAIHQDKAGRIWIGTDGGGINLFNENNGGSFTRIVDKNSSVKKIESLSINCIYEDKTKETDEIILWFGTSDGLLRMVVSNDPSVTASDSIVKNVKFFTSKDGLEDNSIKSIVSDQNGNLWLGTNSGLTLFDLKSNSFSSYDKSDGLTGNEINLNCALKTNDGTIIFGSSEGVNLFYPDRIQKSDFNPNVVLTGFQIFNEEIKPGLNSALQQNIVYAKEINLDHSQNVFSFQFSALDHNSPKSIKYAYMMEGFDKDWVFSNRRFITYTNLNPGKYKFKVKATNSDGIWSKNIASVDLIISPPWWRTIWAYFAYVIIIVVGLLLIRRTEVNRNRLRNELKIREIEAEKLRDVEKIKSRFFANLSHEFRTPLLLIKGPVEQLENNPSVDPYSQIQLIKRNAEKLQTLIDQLLELSQLESDAIPLRARKENIIPIIKGIFYSFESFANRENIQLNFDSSLDEMMIWIDRDKLEKILNNLLSNAFKFTNENGRIDLKINMADQTDNKFLKIILRDSGIGIPSDKVNKIFERFYQVDNETTRNYAGSGIGLSLVKELIDLHRWHIEVNSKIGEGTEFIISIPFSDDYLDENQKIYDGDYLKIEKSNFTTYSPINSDITNNRIRNLTAVSDKPTLLIVEDSEDVRIYLMDILKEYYNLFVAENGDDGLRMGMEVSPDLIISDVMMPQMDGIEFCKRIKSNWQTSHIPVILLTAKASSENKIEGLETGADDYLTKPFSYRELSARIKNLLEQRRLLKEKYGRDINFKPENITSNLADREFLDKLLLIISKNLSDPLFDSEKFAEKVFLSRSQLHRKIQAITGQSTGEFIRTARLKRAGEMILEKKFSLTQISYEVGFNSPSHFTKAFKQFFGCLPSEFVNKSNS